MTSIPQVVSPPGMGAGLGVTLGDLSFNQGGLDVDSGAEFYLSKIDGWDSPNLREDVDDRPQAHGAYRGTSYYGVREIALAGVITTPYGATSLRAAKDRLAYVSDLTDTDAVLTVHEEPAKQVFVRRSGRLRFAQTGVHLLRWELDLVAVDPRKYASTARTVTLADGQTATAANIGNFRAGAPLVASFTHGGLLLVGDQPIHVTDAAEINTLDGTALLGDLSVFSSLAADSTFPYLPARSSSSLSFSGIGSVTVTWRDAWV